MSKVVIHLDNRARLVMAVLAASKWPDQEQAVERHAVHPQAKLMRQYIADYTDHPAVAMINNALDQQVAVDDLFAAALRSRGPGLQPAETLPNSFAAAAWLREIAHFQTVTGLVSALWQAQQPAWEEALTDLREIFHDNQLVNFLGQLQGRSLAQDIVIIPNLVYPALRLVLAETAAALYLILPPPKAYGESPPWPYREGADWVLSESCRCLATRLLAGVLTTWPSEKQALFLHAAATLFIEEALNEGESLAYMVRSKKQLALAALPTAVTQLRAYLETTSEQRSLENLEINSQKSKVSLLKKAR